MFKQIGRIDEFMEKEICALLKQDSFNEWAISTIDDEKVFVNSRCSNASQLEFYFVSLNNDPFRVAITDVEEQCKKQGFLEQSIIQIKNGILSRLSTILNFHRDAEDVWFSVSISALEVTLRARLVRLSPVVSTKMYQKVLKYVLQKTCLLQWIADDLFSLIECKDKAVEYLRENVQELGGEKAISRWAPQGSYNARSLEKYAPPLELQSCLEVSNDPMRAAESLTMLRPDFRNYTRSPSRSPRRRQRGSQFTATNLTPLLNQNQDQSNVLKPDNPSPRRATSDSPSKRQKFGKVKISKRR